MLYGFGYTAQVCGWNAYQDLHRIFDLNDPIRAKYPGTTITLSACRQLRQFAHPPQDISQPGYRATLFPLPASFVFFPSFTSVGWNKEASKPSQDNRLASPSRHLLATVHSRLSFVPLVLHLHWAVQPRRCCGLLGVDTSTCVELRAS